MERAGLKRSMSKKGCSPDNSVCKGIVGRLKNEMFYNQDWIDVRKSAETCTSAEAKEKIIVEIKMKYERIENSTISSYQLYRNREFTKEEYIALHKQNQGILEDLKGQIEDLQNEITRDAADKNGAEEENFCICSMLDEYDGDIVSKIIDKILIYSDWDMQVVSKGNDFFQSVCKEAGKWY